MSPIAVADNYGMAGRHKTQEQLGTGGPVGWLFAVAIAVLVGCASPPAPSPPDFTDKLPSLGETRSHVHQLLGDRLVGDEFGSGYYRVHVRDQYLHLGILYSKTHDGVLHVMQLNFHHPDEISGAARDEIRRIYVGVDARELRTSQMPSMITYDVASPSPGDDMAAFDSRSLGKRLQQSYYWMQPGGGWLQGTCPNTDPGMLEVYHGQVDGQLVRIGIFSAFMDHCEYKFMQL